MPAIQDWTPHGGAQGGSLGPGPQGYSVGTALVQAGQEIGRDLLEVRQREIQGTVSRSLAQLRLDSEKGFLQAQQDAAADGNGFAKGVDASFYTQRSQIAKGITDRAAKEMFNDRSELIRQDLELRATEFETGQRSAIGRLRADESLGQVTAAVEHNPDSAAIATAEHLQTIDALEATPAERDAMRLRHAHAIAGAAMRGFARKDPGGVLQAIANPGDRHLAERFPALMFQDVQERHDLEQFARAELVDQKAATITAAYAKSPREGIRATVELAKSDIAPDLRSAIQATVGQRLGQLRVQRRQEHVEDITELERAIATDTAGPRAESLTRRLYESGAFTVDEYANALGQIDASQIRRAKANAGAAEISKALAAGLPLDPKDEDQRKALTSYFNVSTAGTETGSEPWLEAGQAIAKQTRILPEPVYAWTRQALRSPDPGIAAKAAEYFGAVAAAVPDAVSGFDSDSRVFAATVNGMLEAGTPPIRAVETARANVFDVPEATRANRAHAWSNGGKDSLVNGQESALAGYVGRYFDPGLFASQPETMDSRVARIAGARQVRPDFDALTQSYFSKTGDVALARDLAWSDIQRVYGPSEVNGEPTVMAFPPERWGMKPDEIRAEIAQLLADNPQDDGSKPDDIVLVPDAVTLRLVGDALSGQPVAPSYALGRRDGDVMVNAQGQRIRYALPAGEELTKRIRAAEEKAEAEAQAQVEAARKHRESIRQAREHLQLDGGY